MAAVTVVGGGVVGLTSALLLARAGHEVRCVRDVPSPGTVSAVAGGLWFPYHVEPRDRVVGWGLTSLRHFTSLAADPGTGVALREGLLVERGGPDRWWTEGLTGWRDATPDELPEGAPSGVVARVPLVAMVVYLDWLERACVAAGVELVDGRVEVLDDQPGDLVVLAAGLRAPALLPGLEVSPSRGQVALLANPGLDRWLVDDGAPGGMTYVLPHRGWVVCGGSDAAGDRDEPDPQEHEQIVERCRRAVPALRDAEVLGARVGLRPVAPAVDLRVHDLGGRPVVTNVGHGGAGVTLSWGCAEEVTGLVGDLVRG
ncbi:NAD(P)/FAD-dependent oxidoreductase [Phycicoccus jejuensis]|uniref:NAD(P)/FAD-dependent oxidoreductase n=1 Tax=Phycicoccus jejuensis TaxID=367299 RepID=UPI0005630871|nr:FAD-dependent oxidoreductase [Phycicoccus jejuensis]